MMKYVKNESKIVESNEADSFCVSLYFICIQMKKYITDTRKIRIRLNQKVKGVTFTKFKSATFFYRKI